MYGHSLTPWQELLSKKLSNIADEYGPNSQAVGSALFALQETSWLSQVGQPWLEPDVQVTADLLVVRSWDEALSMRRDFPTYNANGILEAPCVPLDEALGQDSKLKSWWQRAREDAKQYATFGGWIPQSLPDELQDFLFENLYEFVSMLLAEIVAPPKGGDAYFREQLSWFAAGHFPCGWDGAWPAGRMRIY